ncbi:hypothetical protein Bca101_022741 [Brassica carinata]
MEQLLATMSSQKYHPIEDKFTFTIHEEIHNVFKRLSGPILEAIISFKPDVDIELFNTNVTSFARWMSHVVTSDIVRSKNWKEKMHWIRNQGPHCTTSVTHTTCWAIAAVELISALRFILGYDTEYTDYSAQFLVDFVNVKRGERKCAETNGNHYCFDYTIAKALEFVVHAGIPEAKDWVYVGCRAPNGPPNYRPQNIPRFYIKSVTKISSIHEALPYLQFHPIGAALAFFEPDYYLIKDGVYRGPVYIESVYKGFHYVNIYAIIEENGETIALVKSSHGERYGDGGYFKVSCDVLMIEVPWEGINAHTHYRQPMRLLSRFSFPTFA